MSLSFVASTQLSYSSLICSELSSGNGVGCATAIGRLAHQYVISELTINARMITFFCGARTICKYRISSHSAVPLMGQLSNQLLDDLTRLAELQPILPVTLLEPNKRLLLAHYGR